MPKNVPMVSMNIVGLEALDKLLIALPVKVSRKVQRKGTTAASTVMRKAYRLTLRQATKKLTGRLWASPARKFKYYRRTDTDVAIVGPQYSRKKKGQRAAPHAHLIEFGTKMRQHKSGKSTGRIPVPAIGPLRKAWDQSLPKMRVVMRKKIAEGLKKEVKGLRAKYVRRKLR